VAKVTGEAGVRGSGRGVAEVTGGAGSQREWQERARQRLLQSRPSCYKSAESYSLPTEIAWHGEGQHRSCQTQVFRAKPS